MARDLASPGLAHRIKRLTPAWIARFLRVLVASWRAWVDHRAASKGAALAFYTLFSMAPILIVAIAVAGYFFGDKAAQGGIVAELSDLVGPNGAQAIAAMLASARNRGAGLLATMVAAVLVVIACLFAVIYKMLPDAPLSWSDVWVGSIVTALLFTVGKFAIGVYLSRSGVASSFGAAGSLVALLLWIYYSAQIFFFGAEYTRHFALRFGSLRRQSRAMANQGTYQPARPGMCDSEQMARSANAKLSK
jgi:uncharacterized BrkB/YihY/UPF0761 family membrane protein